MNSKKLITFLNREVGVLIDLLDGREISDEDRRVLRFKLFRHLMRKTS